MASEKGLKINQRIKRYSWGKKVKMLENIFTKSVKSVGEDPAATNVFKICRISAPLKITKKWEAAPIEGIRRTRSASFSQ